MVNFSVCFYFCFKLFLYLYFLFCSSDKLLSLPDFTGWPSLRSLHHHEIQGYNKQTRKEDTDLQHPKATNRRPGVLLVGLQMPTLYRKQPSSCSVAKLRLTATPWTAVRQASLSFIISQSLLKFMSTELVMLSNRLILCCSLILRPVQSSALLGRTEPPGWGQVAWRRKMGISSLLGVPLLPHSCLWHPADSKDPDLPHRPRDSAQEMWTSYFHTASGSWVQVLGFLHLRLTERWTRASQSDPLHPGPGILGRYRWIQHCPSSILSSLVESRECLVPHRRSDSTFSGMWAQRALPAALEPYNRRRRDLCPQRMYHLVRLLQTMWLDDEGASSALSQKPDAQCREEEV